MVSTPPPPQGKSEGTLTLSYAFVSPPPPPSGPRLSLVLDGQFPTQPSLTDELLSGVQP